MDKTSIGLIIVLFIAVLLGEFLLESPTTSEPYDLYIGSGNGEIENGKILNVPFVRQNYMYCSEASASMVLRYYGYDISQEEVHDNISDRFENMVEPLSEYLPCRMKSLGLSDLKKEIDENDPVMIRLQFGRYRHTVVVVGYDENFLYLHDPEVSEYMEADPNVLLEYWEPTGYAAIVID